ncbi:MAG: TrkH family potassium uptake protein [Gammaproteobacteria bacterium SHHR-1]|uniref:TrkH family potassium uptake protein n=1 Tax=Magnetovirga frankeli TaxID=947516 RepID=UPI001292FF4A|nr:potassium transporter [gamma proteobacterium SS-5]
MHWRAITRLFGIFLLLYSLSFAPSLGVSLFYADAQWLVFVSSLLLTAGIGLLLWLPNFKAQAELSVRDGFLVVTLFWIILSLVGALPFSLGLHLNLTDAVFESVSGFTTTGATVITGLDQLPPSILYHRQQMQWLGGMGVIVLAVAILPLLGVGGMQLYRAEASGVAKQEKLTPRIAETARALWMIYLLLTLACALGYWLAGMQLFDAIGHAFTTVATGGFSTHDASLGHYNSPLIETIAIVFMLAGGVNFAVHFVALRRATLRPYVADTEVRVFLLIFALSSLFIAFSLYWVQTYSGALESLRYAAFQVASILTSTGFGTATFAEWPLHVPLVLVILSFTGGCAGSTAGGIKVMRILLLAKLGLRQLFQLAHPQAISVIKVGRKPVSEDILFSVWGFYVLYIVTALLLTVAMMAAGLDLESAFGAVVATINLLGPGLGEVASTFASANDAVKWLGVFGMLVGRLEVFTLLILFLPAYWRH